jgi:hypothetical protein
VGMKERRKLHSALKINNANEMPDIHKTQQPSRPLPKEKMLLFNISKLRLKKFFTK